MKAQDRARLMQTLQARFEKNPRRHGSIAWEQVVEKLQRSPAAIGSLGAMELSGGEPDVIGAQSYYAARGFRGLLRM